MSTCDRPEIDTLQKFCSISRKRRWLDCRSIPVLLTIATLTGGCEKPAEPPNAPIPGPKTASCVAGGRLAVDTYGAVEAHIDWSADDMTCEGMPRPADEGARLRFAGQIGGGNDEGDGERRYLAFIFSIATLTPGQGGEELPTRVTIIEEDEGRFFSTQEADVCWSDVKYHAPPQQADATPMTEQSRIDGLLYCVAPIAELNGTASITLSDLAFSGQLRWNPDP